MDAIEERLAFETHERLALEQRVLGLETALADAYATITTINNSLEVITDGMERQDLFLIMHTRHHEQVEGNRYVGQAINHVLDESLARRGAKRAGERNFKLGVQKDGQ